MAPKHVIIVGAGLAGPALAIALSRHGVRSTILEIRSTASTAGGALMLAPNALRVLDKICGVYPQVRSSGFEFDNIQFHSEDGMFLGGVCIGEKDAPSLKEETERGKRQQGYAGEEEDRKYRGVRVMRSALHSALIDICKGLPDVDMLWGKTLEKIEEKDDGVVVIMQDGSSVSGESPVTF